MAKEVAWIFLKTFVIILIVSLLLSLANIFPYYLNMVRATNDILMRATINNYVLKSQVDNVIKSSFVDAQVFSQLTYKEGNNYYKLSNSNEPTGVYVYANVNGNFPKGGCNPGEYCAQYAVHNSRVILTEGARFDPKTNPDDTLRFRNTYKGANRDDTITIRLETKMKAKVLFIGFNIDFEIPLVVEKSGPAMFYYRM